MRTAENLVQHELIGLHAKTGKTAGKVVWETRNTLTIDTEKGERTLEKKSGTFVFSLGKQKIEVKGNLLVGRPEDRIKKNKR